MKVLGVSAIDDCDLVEMFSDHPISMLPRIPAVEFVLLCIEIEGIFQPACGKLRLGAKRAASLRRYAGIHGTDPPISVGADMGSSAVLAVDTDAREEVEAEPVREMGAVVSSQAALPNGA